MNSIARITHKAAGFPPAPSWHELVQPGPKGDPRKKLARAEREVRGVVIRQAGTGISRAQRREVGNRRYAPGRLVEHRTRAKAWSGYGIDRTRLTDAAIRNRAARAEAKAQKALAATR